MSCFEVDCSWNYSMGSVRAIIIGEDGCDLPHIGEKQERQLFFRSLHMTFQMRYSICIDFHCPFVYAQTISMNKST